MTARKLIFALMMLSVVVLGSLVAVNSALQEGGVETEIIEEEFEATGGETIELQFSNLEHTRYSETVRVYDNQDNVFPESGNYEWESNNGTITVLEGSNLSEENTAFIDYEYFEATDNAVAIFDLTEPLTRILSLLTFVLVAGLLITSVKIFGRS